MDLRDFIVTPLAIIGVYALAYYLRSRLSNLDTYRYFLPALSVKILGALALGFIYQYYYHGGDTYNFHTFGSRVIWETFGEDPFSGMRMIISPDSSVPYKYASRVVFYQDSSSMVVIRIAALLDLITFSSYSATGVLFAFLSFLGLWFFFLTFYELFPALKGRIAICALFIPSVVFWGSGILKDTIVLGCLGVLTFAIKRIFIDKKASLFTQVALVIAPILIFAAKKYVLLCYAPAVILWVYMSNLKKIRSLVLRILLVPAIIIITIISGYFAVRKIGDSDPRYALDKISATAQITAYDIRYYTGKDAGSGYSLGELDGSFGSMIALFPQAVNVSLFRPYLWESKNALMLLSSIEATLLLAITLALFLRYPVRSAQALRDPTVIFCLVFSITFAFAVGVSTYNFGTLTRYRIPMLPFYLLALVLLADSSKRDRNVEELERTE